MFALCFIDRGHGRLRRGRPPAANVSLDGWLSPAGRRLADITGVGFVEQPGGMTALSSRDPGSA